MAAKVHPTALVSPQAELGQGVEIGPFAVIEDQVVVGDETRIDSHVVVNSNVTIGRGNHIYPFAAIGTDPQDLTYQGQETSLVVGDENIIREYVTFHRGSPKGGGVTKVGSQGMFMAYTHVAHDCQVGDHVVMANVATLAGHVQVEDWAAISAMSAVHQFGRVGAHSFVGAVCGVPQDVPPFCMVAGNRAQLYGLNTVGLKRRGFSEETLSDLKQAYRILFRNKGSLMATNLSQVEEELGHVPEVKHLVEFVRASERGVCR